jgi:hypothetical protein
MSPAQIACRKQESRLTLTGMAAEIAYVGGLALVCCLACALVYFLLR